MSCTTLVTIVVKIHVQDGRYNWPDFTRVSSKNRHHMDWCFFIDKAGSGWRYYKSGSTQYATAKVPSPFAIEAAQLFPNNVTIQ